jgi:hypothetical protein
MNLDDQDATGRMAALAMQGVLRRWDNAARVPSAETFSHVRSLATPVVAWTASCTGIPESHLVAAIEHTLDSSNDGFFVDDTLNIYLSLHCGDPSPPFYFYRSARPDLAMFEWASRSVAFQFTHAAFRSRVRGVLDGRSPGALGPHDELVGSLARLVPGNWGPAWSARDAACDFAFWGKQADPSARDIHRQLVDELRTAGFLGGAG